MARGVGWGSLSTTYRGTEVALNHGDGPSVEEASALVKSLKKQVKSDRMNHISRRMKENSEKVLDVTRNFYKLSMERKNLKINCDDGTMDLLAKRQNDAFDLHDDLETSNGDDESSSSDEDGHPASAVLLGLTLTVKNAVCPIMLPEVKRLPPYTTWIFLDRNQRMTEDQSVLGRRQIYYDQDGGETLISSDSEDETGEEEEEKKEFAETEDYILRTTIKAMGLYDLTLGLLSKCFSRSPSEIRARYEDLIKKDNAICHMDTGNAEGSENPYLDKDLDAALDSFDNLFCRRCLVFDCRLHGCSQDLIFPAEKQLEWSSPDAEKEPCGPNCHRMLQVLESGGNATMTSQQTNLEEKAAPGQMQRRELVGVSFRHNPSEIASSSEIRLIDDVTSSEKNTSVGKSGGEKRSSKRVAENVLAGKNKMQKKSTMSDSDSVAGSGLSSKDMYTQGSSLLQNVDMSSQNATSKGSTKSQGKEAPLLDSDKSLQVESASVALNETAMNQPLASSNDTLKKDEVADETLVKQEVVDNTSWKPLEKALYEKGIQIFGRNSCLIARNLLSGLKSCSEVFKYMHQSEKMSLDGDGMTLSNDCSKADGNEIVAGGPRRRSKFLRRRKGRARRLKYTWKSAGYQSYRKRISEKRDQPYPHYTPCRCQSACGKTCPCHVNRTCCEKYCGCSKNCKNRFRGCHCAKSQCRSRQCPCFAANRECDPDICRNCWLSCGDGSLGVPSQRGDNYECRNMKLLLKQQQRILLGRSDISGWGAFLKNSVSKHEFLGEYTGEVVSHHEADKRGKIYDRINCSYLFNLNNQFVLDAHRRGDKLKFANHSLEPNCYARVFMVAGDHRVAIFAKDRIAAGEELFYDYRYEPDRCPDWARKLEASGSSKKDTSAPSRGRAKKHI
ncbi:histone-lysine N-methyltransferase CLF-like isoform X2 [Andrographis paniculata]|uniref:histone-lysine N-methyltransferase CLF-like isoform X2 n=1 Tax=Andrographis paniculata TaxID=175694 RepID=UPI0021E77F1A|nr:histone-lysine N-methyltransferase CLF-like isoform X2 [Andrographis paniculata]